MQRWMMNAILTTPSFWSERPDRYLELLAEQADELCDLLSMLKRRAYRPDAPALSERIGRVRDRARQRYARRRDQARQAFQCAHEQAVAQFHATRVQTLSQLRTAYDDAMAHGDCLEANRIYAQIADLSPSLCPICSRCRRTVPCGGAHASGTTLAEATLSRG